MFSVGDNRSTSFGIGVSIGSGVVIVSAAVDKLACVSDGIVASISVVSTGELDTVVILLVDSGAGASVEVAECILFLFVFIQNRTNIAVSNTINESPQMNILFLYL